MNKIACISSYYRLMKYYGFGDSGMYMSTASDIRKFDDWICGEFGMDNLFALKYRVTDESKFTVFMLRHPECIEKIIYE